MITKKSDERRKWLLEKFRSDRYAAHQFLFEHRHKNDSAVYQKELVDLLCDPHPLIAIMAFRGAAKSTFIEEHVLLAALFGEIKYALLVGPKWESACDRLVSIRSELENNDRLIDLFGDQKATPWSLDELVLSNGVKLQAVGAGQSLRGKKYNAERPDFAVIDDLEDEDSVRTEESRHRMDRWMAGTLRPALPLDTGRIRFLGTPIHPKSLIFTKCKDPEWKSKTFPAITIDMETGEEKSLWPSRFPLEKLKKLRSEYINSGNMLEWQQEYMCVSEDVAAKPFQASMIKVEPVSQSWLPVQMMVDPARTVKASSARTGYAAWSWLGNRLIVHKAEGHFHKPDEIIRTILQWDAKFSPVRIGIEAVGLEEFIMQPLRAACAKEGRSLPWGDERAPRDKISFIKGLQPFYIAGEVIHVEAHPDLESELLSFPTGRMDVVNALAYALRMRAGRPVYDDFGVRHIAPILEVRPRTPLYLCVSSRAAMTAGVLMQYIDGALKVYTAWVFNEPPKECFERLLREAVLAGGGQVKLLAPVSEFDQWNNTGLPAAIRATGNTPVRTASTKNCEGQLRPWLQQQSHGMPKLLVHESARWVVNGLSSGYARRIDKHGHLQAAPNDDQYRLCIEALESMVAWLAQSAMMEDDGGFNYAVTKGGQRYISLRPQ